MSTITEDLAAIVQRRLAFARLIYAFHRLLGRAQAYRRMRAIKRAEYAMLGAHRIYAKAITIQLLGQ